MLKKEFEDYEDLIEKFGLVFIFDLIKENRTADQLKMRIRVLRKKWT